MARRRDARRLAVSIVYQADSSGRDPVDVLAERRDVGERVAGFSEVLVRGVAERIGELDTLLGAAADDWSVHRLAAVDRAVLRVACFELLYGGDTPPAVVIDEAVAAVKELSTDESGAFVNGVLGRIARDNAETREGRSEDRPSVALPPEAIS